MTTCQPAPLFNHTQTCILWHKDATYVVLCCTFVPQYLQAYRRTGTELTIAHSIICPILWSKHSYLTPNYAHTCQVSCIPPPLPPMTVLWVELHYSSCIYLLPLTSVQLSTCSRIAEPEILLWCPSRSRRRYLGPPSIPLF